MTPGEIARWTNATQGFGCDLTVVPMRKDGRAPTRREIAETPAWVLPSPNMPTPETALVYPGACLLEGTNLSEGRGTTRPFELLGAPWLDADDAAERANALGMPGVAFRPHVFKPTFQKHAGKTCGGVQVHVTDAARVPPVRDVSAPPQGAVRHGPGPLPLAHGRGTSTATTSRRSTS